MPRPRFDCIPTCIAIAADLRFGSSLRPGQGPDGTTVLSTPHSSGCFRSSTTVGTLACQMVQNRHSSRHCV